jgi:alpha-mannosidase
MRQAHWFNQPLQAIATSVHPGSLPLGQGLVEIEPASLVVSAIKLPERGEGLILRVYNPTSATLHGQIRLARPFTRAQATTMEETKTQWLARNSDRITLTVRAAQIITLKFVFSA